MGNNSQQMHKVFWKIVVGISLVLGIIVSVITIGSWINSRVSTPQKTLDAFCDGWLTSNPVEIYDQLNAQLQAQSTVSDYQQKIEHNKSIEVMKTCTYSPVQEYGSSASAVVTIVGVKGTKVSYTVTLVQENKIWKITGTS